MPDHTPPLTESHHPATFRDRGAAVPFTTPLLAGARVRHSTRGAIELVVPNPSGARGVYILHWSGVRALCSPTTHDTMLFNRFVGLAEIDPAGIRDAALAVALDGHAGREAMAAAEATKAADHTQRVRTHFLLLMRLMEQIEPSVAKVTSLADRAPDFERRVGAALHRMAPAFGRSAAELAGALTAIANVFAPVGATPDDRHARMVRLIGRLDEAVSTLSAWLDAEPSNDIGGLGRAVMAAMKAASESAKAMLRTTRQAMVDPLALLKRWNTDPAATLGQAMRCDWLLDGWERVSLLWLVTKTNGFRRAALLEMPLLVPVLPREVMEWTDASVPAEAMDLICRVTSLDDAWRSGGAAFPLIERNEKLRAMGV